MGRSSQVMVVSGQGVNGGDDKTGSDLECSVELEETSLLDIGFKV
jgi:hypothetical protein